MSPKLRRVWANANVSGPLPAATRLRLPNACVPDGNDDGGGGGGCVPFLVTPSPMMAMLSSCPKALVFVKRAIGDEPLLRLAPTPPSILGRTENYHGGQQYMPDVLYVWWKLETHSTYCIRTMNFLQRSMWKFQLRWPQIPNLLLSTGLYARLMPFAWLYITYWPNLLLLYSL